MVQVVDYHGREIASYAPSDKRMYPGLLACYRSQTVVFLGVNEGDYLHLNKAERK
jgi:hypothetical protein